VKPLKARLSIFPIGHLSRKLPSIVDILADFDFTVVQVSFLSVVDLTRHSVSLCLHLDVTAFPLPRPSAGGPEVNGFGGVFLESQVQIQVQSWSVQAVVGKIRSRHKSAVESARLPSHCRSTADCSSSRIEQSKRSLARMICRSARAILCCTKLRRRTPACSICTLKGFTKDPHKDRITDIVAPITLAKAK
jgi:hypothetical protein